METNNQFIPFTLEQIKAAHSKVKSGADFPKYIHDITALGVESYETFVTDGHTVFSGGNNYTIQSDPKYPMMEISGGSDIPLFGRELKEHQQGKTTFPEFCVICARLGVEKWKVSIADMSCTYFDKEGKQMLKEHIPG